MTDGQSLALEQLKEIVVRDDYVIDIEDIREPSASAKTWLIIEISLHCGGLPSAPGGLVLRERERSEICVPEDFPFHKPGDGCDTNGLQARRMCNGPGTFGFIKHHRRSGTSTMGCSDSLECACTLAQNVRRSTNSILKGARSIPPSLIRMKNRQNASSDSGECTRSERQRLVGLRPRADLSSSSRDRRLTAAPDKREVHSLRHCSCRSGCPGNDLDSPSFWKTSWSAAPSCAISYSAFRQPPEQRRDSPPYAVVAYSNAWC